MKAVLVSVAVMVAFIPVSRPRAMQIATSGDELILSGTVISGDTPRITDTLEKNPRVLP